MKFNELKIGVTYKFSEGNPVYFIGYNKARYGAVFQSIDTSKLETFTEWEIENFNFKEDTRG